MATQSFPQTSHVDRSPAESATDRSVVCAENVQEYMNRGAEQFREMVADNAQRSVLVALAAGFGVGLVLGKALGGSSRESHWFDRATCERLGQRMLAKVEGLVPESLTK